MIRDAQTHTFQMMIAWKSSRAFRNMKDAMNYEEKLMHHGVRCVYIKEDFSDTAAGRFAKRTMMNVNQFYSENMAEDIMRGMVDNAEKNLVNCKPPLGYKRGEDGRFAIDEPNARVVQEIFQRFASGEPLADIARDLNARGIKTGSKGRWGKNSFQALLGNERYTGVYIWGNIRTPGGMPKIIEREIFDEVQRMIKTSKAIKGRKGPNAEYMLTGKLFCGHCKSPMVGVSGTSRSGQTYYYYSCNQARSGKCRKKNAARDWAERNVADAIVNYVLQDHIIEWIADNTATYYEKRKEWSRVNEIEHRLKDVGKAIDNLMAAILQGIITDTTKGKMIELEEEKSILQEQLRQEKRALPEITREKVIFWLESFRGADTSNRKFQRVIFDNFLTAAYLFDDELRIVFDFTGIANEIILPLDKEKTDQAIDSASGKSVLIEPVMVHHSKPIRTPSMIIDGVRIETLMPTKGEPDEPSNDLYDRKQARSGSFSYIAKAVWCLPGGCFCYFYCNHSGSVLSCFSWSVPVLPDDICRAFHFQFLFQRRLQQGREIHPLLFRLIAQPGRYRTVFLYHAQIILSAVLIKINIHQCHHVTGLAQSLDSLHAGHLRQLLAVILHINPAQANYIPRHKHRVCVISPLRSHLEVRHVNNDKIIIFA
jgi:site-specific DNA recombinase